MSTPAVNIDTFTHTGRRITPQEAMFIAAYMVHKNGARAVQEAGYKSKAPATYNIENPAGKGEEK